MTLDRRHRAVAGARHRRLRRQDPGRRRAVHQGRPVGPAGGGRAAGLRGDGRLRCGDQHRRGDPRRHRGGHRLRRRRRRGHRRRRARRRHDDHRRRRGRRASWSGREAFGATHTVNSTDHRRRSRRSRQLTGGFGADVVIEAVGRPETYQQAFYARDLAGHRGPGRRADAGHHGGAAADRRLRPGRRAQVLLVRRLPALPGLPDADRPLPAGPVRPRRLRLRDDPARTASRTPSPRCTAARSCARSSSGESCPDRHASSRTARSASTAARGTSTTTSGSSATTTSAS